VKPYATPIPLDAFVLTAKRNYRVVVMRIRKGRRVVYLLHTHMVFGTKRRGKVCNIVHLKRLEEIC
jgi:hypothetical protein